MATSDAGDILVRLGLSPVHPRAGSRVGIAENVVAGVWPINALRHPVHGETCGWYIWAGEELSDDADFFKPLHVEHLPDWCPLIIPFLALPPGWRVLLAPGYEDVWFDPDLLSVS